MLNLLNLPPTLKKASLKKIFLLTLIAVLLAIAVSIFSVRVIFPFQSQKNLGVCVLKAKKDYEEQWSATCLSLYSPVVIQEYGEARLCATMANLYAAPLNQNYQRQIDDCLNRYPQ